MANDTTITVTGNLTADPEVRFVGNGSAVANFTIASTPRQFDKHSGEWKDGETLFLRCSAWRDLAENIAESLTKGTAVIAQGNLKSRSYESKGEKRTVTELDVTEIGPSLARATAKVTRAAKGDTRNGSQRSQAPAQGAWGQQSAPAPTQNVWGAQGGAQDFGGPAPF